MAKGVVRRTAAQKTAALKRFEGRAAARVERSMYLEGQAVPPSQKTVRVTKLRDGASRVE